jgi:hypothetical protein
VAYHGDVQAVWVVLAAVVGAVAHIGGQELWQVYRTRRYRGERSRSILGDWSGTWWLGNDEGAAPYVPADSIRILQASNRQIRGEGRDEKGTYRIDGHVSEHGIVSMFYGYRKMSLNGVAILQPSPRGDEYTGWWHGYIKEGRIDGGVVRWRRADG